MTDRHGASRREPICTCKYILVPMPSDNCTCHMPPDDRPHLTNDCDQGQMAFDGNSNYETANGENSLFMSAEEGNFSQNLRDESSLGFSANERATYDASNERSRESRPTRRRLKSRVRGRRRPSGYDATFEDSVDVDATFKPKFHSSMIEARGQISPVRRNEEIECHFAAEMPEPQSRRESSMNSSERRRRNELHALLDEDSSFTAEESILELPDDPVNVNILGYNYRVNSFR